jgi:hypothetical protein
VVKELECPFDDILLLCVRVRIEIGGGSGDEDPAQGGPNVSPKFSEQRCSRSLHDAKKQ